MRYCQLCRTELELIPEGNFYTCGTCESYWTLPNTLSEKDLLRLETQSELEKELYRTVRIRQPPLGEFL